jgi:LemA protein
MEGTDALWAGLAGAANQFGASLAVARQRPLDPDSIAALDTARQVLVMAWQRVQDEAHDLAGAQVPQTTQVQWQLLVSQSAVAADSFNLAVTSYNEAIAQFPALLLASLFGFKPARTL